MNGTVPPLTAEAFEQARNWPIGDIVRRLGIPLDDGRLEVGDKTNVLFDKSDAMAYTPLDLAQGWLGVGVDAAAVWILDPSAPVPEPPPAPGHRALSLGDFLAVERPALVYHIHGLLPAGGKMLITAPAKAGKTFLALETGMALATGNIEWLGLRFGEPCKVLLIQPELSDTLLAARIKAILREAPPEIDRGAILKNFSIVESAGGRPNLATKEGRMRAEKAIERTGAEVLICDPLYMLFPGLEENAADQMTKALDYISGLCERFHCAVVLVHHHGKGGQSRGSSVLQGWGETDLSLSYPDQNRHPDIIRVDGLFRCSFGTGFPCYWHKPGEGGPWFSVADDYKLGGPGRKPKAGVEHAVAAVRGRDGVPYGEVVREVMALADCSEKPAKRAIKDAMETGAIVQKNAFYFPSGKVG